MDEQGYLDLHVHILPGVDDGARDLDASLAIIEGLAEVGFRRLVATPHADGRRHLHRRPELVERTERLREAVEARGLPVRIETGAEYAYDQRFHADVHGGEAMTLGDSHYVLLELPESAVPASMANTLFEVGTRGYFPILAHPERCAPYQDDPQRLEQLAAGRALVQVSFRSLAGTFGRTIKKTAWRLVEDEIADLVATDCHSPRELKKIVRPVLAELEKRLSPDRLDRLLRRIPARLLSETAPRTTTA